MIGFTNGIAVLIANAQVKDFFGLHLDKVPGVFWLRVEALAREFSYSLSFEATTLAVLTRAGADHSAGALSARKIPGPIVALLLSTVCGLFFSSFRWQRSGRGLEEFRVGCRTVQIPQFRTDLIHGLLGPAFTVAMLGAIESLMSAVVSDRMSNDRHNPNVELIGQGVANIVSPMFGGLPATGAIARTATSIRSGAQTPVAGMIHSLTLLCILLFAAPLASYVPMAALASILMIVAYNLGEWREIPQLLKLTKTDINIWMVTFALTTLFADLTVAVEAGMILAALFILSAAWLRPPRCPKSLKIMWKAGGCTFCRIRTFHITATIFRIHGAVFVLGRPTRSGRSRRICISCRLWWFLRLRNMTALDATGLFAIEEVAKQLHANQRAR